MKKKIKHLLMGLAAAVVVSLGGPSARAANILYYVDGVLGTDRMAGALAAVTGPNVITVAANQGDFATKIATGSYDLGILFQQDVYGAGSAFAALSTFVAGGGRAIVADWTKTNSNVAGLGATFTGNTNANAFTVSNPGLAAGLTNPVSLSSPGWGVFSTGLNGANVAATFNSGGEGAIIIGNGGRSIVNGFLSDTFSDGAQGTQLYINEINSVLSVGAVPEPSSVVMLGLGAAGAVGAAVRKRRNAMPRA